MSAIEEIVESASRKRKLENDEKEEENLSKRKLVANEPEIHLLDLAEEILMEILSKLDGESLHTLGSWVIWSSNRILTDGWLISFSLSPQFKRLVRDKKLWTQAIFSSSELDIWEIFKRLKYIVVSTKLLKIQGNCKKESVERRPLVNRQTFKEIMKRIVERSPLLESLHFDKIWFDWTKEVSYFGNEKKTFL